ncbi:MAG: hypothetical protein AXA67_01495 [Methylothermaceae bacteria B42]|nr:MAG: hypothetical protein AXA67_01495 [Methylothermaceae bacteria B42]HHJ39047.1 slipin family protein [Methylothermaceae bacterium]
MLFFKKIIVPETHRGLLFRNEQFQKVLMPGVYRLLNWNRKYRVLLEDISTTLENGVSDEVLKVLKLHPEILGRHLQSWQTGEQEVGLVYNNGALREIKPPAREGAYWRGFGDIEVRKLNILREFKLDKTLARIVLASKAPQLRASAVDAVITATIPQQHVGFLEIDGEQPIALEPGIHAWWKFNRNLKIRQIDCRLQNMEVNGQEILTKDRVSLRINLSATWQVADALKVCESLASPDDFLYRELQLALRAVVSTQTLDELLEDKNQLNQEVKKIAAKKAAEYGITVVSVGARDIVLPGEMKTILAQVVEAQKRAEANLIKRREETQATRSLHNTAKVMEGNPTLLRLKELEVLEKITSQISTLNVYGGLDGILNDMVRIPAALGKTANG